MRRRSCVHYIKPVGCGIECKDGCPSHTRVRPKGIKKQKAISQKDNLAYEKEMTRIKRLGY